MKPTDMEIKLRTEIHVEPRTGLLPYNRPVLLLGSCFSDNIGRRLAERGFNVVANPLGPVYNAAAMVAQTALIASGREVQLTELFEHEHLWRHFLAHTLLARPDRKEAADALNEALDRARSILLSSLPPLVCLTLGTAWAFTLADGSGFTVANCHKLPAIRFNRRLMPLSEVTSCLTDTISTIRKAAPGADIIVTVSPIRHLADGLDGNSLSKAILRVAADAATRIGAIYFPAFEAITDDLRDYRFYNPDMTHPTEQAADYVFNLFENAYTDASTRELARQALTRNRRLAHRNFFSTTPR